MLRDLERLEEQAQATLDVILHAQADIVLLLNVDWDHGGRGAQALRDALSKAGLDYPHIVAVRPTTGRPSGFDLDGNGALGEARDALGYGRFTGDGGMVLLSRVPLGVVDDRSDLLWSMRSIAPAEVLPEGADTIVPLASVAQWIVPLRVGAADLTLITMNANTPVFDGPEDRNGRRNADELGYIAELADTLPNPIVLGRANLDPLDGAGLRGAITALLTHPARQDQEGMGRHVEEPLVWMRASTS
ncbi:endonuclease/exonuclease/phosphatase family protein [Jannaschia sp.]|nr:endonuclease/exonuclease/phosphatase family protein [Jannaschia sp.]